jgi:hypothetical protein
MNLSKILVVCVSVSVSCCLAMEGLQVNAADPLNELTFFATPRGGKTSIPVALPYVVEYSYEGATALQVTRINQSTGQSQLVRFGTLEAGKILPVAGELYRVRSANHLDAKLEKISEEDIDPASKPAKGSYALPTGSKGKLNSGEFSVESIADVDGRPQATILGFENTKKISGKYRRGDTLTIDGSTFRLLNVVSSSEACAGWIEIEPTTVKKN